MTSSSVAWTLPIIVPVSIDSDTVNVYSDWSKMGRLSFSSWTGTLISFPFAFY